MSYTREEKLEIIKAFLASGETMGAYQKRFGLGHCTLSNWMSNFGITNPLIEQRKAMRRELANKLEKASETAKDEEIARLKAELKSEQLKSEAYKTMIEVAEAELGVEIRKKAGVKQ